MRTRTLEPAFQCGRGPRWSAVGSGRVAALVSREMEAPATLNGDPVALPAGKVPAFRVASIDCSSNATQRNAATLSILV